LKNYKPDSAYEYFELLSERKFLLNVLIEKWKNAKLDVVICPVYATPTFRHEQIGKLGGALVYCAYWNCFNFPAGSVPVTVVAPDEEKYEDKFNDSITAHVKTAMKGSAGLPISVQAVALPYQDEKAMRVLKEIETAVNYKKFAR